MSILGSADSIKKLKRDQMADYFKRRYGPGNMVLAVTGRLDFDEIVKLAEKYMGDWPRVDAPREQPAPMYKPQRHRADRCEAQPPVHDGHDARPQRAGRAPLRRARAGRRHRRLRRQPASTGRWSTTRSPKTPTSASIRTTAAAVFYISLTTDPDRTEQALDIALNELEKVKTRPERRRSRARQEQDRQQPGPFGRSPARPDAQRSAGSGSTTSEYRSLEQDMATLMAVNRRVAAAADAAISRSIR